MNDSGNAQRGRSPWRWLFWLGIGCLVLSGVTLLAIRPAWIEAIPVPTQVLFWLVSIGELAALVFLVWLVLRYQAQQQAEQARNQDAEQRIALAYERLDAFFWVGQKFVEAGEEREIIEPVLKLCIDLVGARGASFVPLDDHGQPSAAISDGEIPNADLEAWVEFLGSPEVGARCQVCSQTGSLQLACPLLHNPTLNATGIFCLSLKRGERQYGMLNLYLPGEEALNQETHALLVALVDQTALALESVRLRRRELDALRQMQVVRQKTDLMSLLASLLENVYQAIDSDFALLIISQPGSPLADVRLVQGELTNPRIAFVDAVAQGVIGSGQPVILGQMTGDTTNERSVRSMLSAPLLSSDRKPLGALVVGSYHSTAFNKRQLSLLQTIAGQVALVVQNADSLAELEYKTIIQERTRLAREIHDSLAQTLGFLKLQAAQIRGYLARGDSVRAQQSLEQYSNALTEAYQDVRQTIDGLRIEPNACGLEGWLEQTADEFRELSGLQVIFPGVAVNSDLPPEVHAQLIRIVQEALSNVRKHAEATTVWIDCYENGGDLWLELRDDGLGFSPEDVSRPSQHGLRGMRERAELIGADFQVASLPQAGTTIRVRLPLKNLRLQESTI